MQDFGVIGFCGALRFGGIFAYAFQNHSFGFSVSAAVVEKAVTPEFIKKTDRILVNGHLTVIKIIIADRIDYFVYDLFRRGSVSAEAFCKGQRFFDSLIFAVFTSFFVVLKY